MQSTTSTTDHVQLQLPLKLAETRAARLERIMSLASGKVATADRFTFTQAAYDRATKTAKGPQ